MFELDLVGNPEGRFYQGAAHLSLSVEKVSSDDNHVPGVPKHMKRFESLITFDSIKICCLLFSLVNVLYIEII